MRIKFVFAVFGVLLLGLGISQRVLTSTVYSQEAKPTAKAKATTETTKLVDELDHLRASAKEFENAFNGGQAPAIAALFSEKAEVVDEDGNVVEGRSNIEARFGELFKNSPKARIVIEVTSLRQLGPDIALEDGVSTVTLDPEMPASRSPYSIVHVKRDGKWLFASVRDFPEESTPTAHDHLKPLEWLVGKWCDESRDGRVETSCQWSDDGNFLLQDYVIKPRRGAELRGSQRIGWDPLRRMIRAWVFDQSGAIVESNWTPIEGTWVIKVEGTTSDGQSVSATRMLTQISADSYQIDSSNQVFAGELLPDSSVRVVRRPPAPKESKE
jgi:uncharacterized protein (TIGR02246 family)